VNANAIQLLLSALLLLTTFILLIQRRIDSMIYTYAWQSAFLSLATLAASFVTPYQWDLFFSALLIFALKVIFIPWFLRYLSHRLSSKNPSDNATSLVARPFLLSMIASALVLFSYNLTHSLRTSTQLFSSNAIAIALSIILLGMLLIITHRKAVSHALGFMVIENGIFFAALILTRGMPMKIELGIAFDVLVAIILFGVFFFHLNTSIDSLDVDSLNRLREGTEL